MRQVVKARTKYYHLAAAVNAKQPWRNLFLWLGHLGNDGVFEPAVGHLGDCSLTKLVGQANVLVLFGCLLQRPSRPLNAT